MYNIQFIFKTTYFLTLNEGQHLEGPLREPHEIASRVRAISSIVVVGMCMLRNGPLSFLHIDKDDILYCPQCQNICGTANAYISTIRVTWLKQVSTPALGMCGPFCSFAAKVTFGDSEENLNFQTFGDIYFSRLGI